MKKFEFRLDPALRLRLTQLKREKEKLQTLLAEESRIKNSLLELESERRKAASALHSSPEIDALDLRTLSAFNIGAEARKISLQANLARQAELIKEARHRVLIAERNATLLEKLKEKGRAEWQAEFDRELERNAQEAWTAVHCRA